MENVEKKFYSEHYKNLGPLNTDMTLDEIDKEYFIKKKRYHIINEILDKNKEYNLLVEVGMGQGHTLSYLNQKFKFKRIIGYDVVDFKKNLLKDFSNIDIRTANFNNDLPLENGTIDCFVLMMVIEHLFNPFHSFAKIRRLLSNNGHAFINLPLFTSIKNRLRLLLGKMPETSVEYNKWFIDKSWDGNHLHYFTMDSIFKICKLNNLEIIKVNPAGNFYFIKRILPWLLCNEIAICVKKKK